MSTADRILQPLPLNAASSSPGASSSTSTPISQRKLAPIFTRTYSRPRSSAAPTPTHPPSSPSPYDDDRARKRVKLDYDALGSGSGSALLIGDGASMDIDDDNDVLRRRLENIQDYFVTTPLRSEHGPTADFKVKDRSRAPAVEEGTWRRRRGRGISSRSILLPPQSYTPTTPCLDTLVTRLSPDPLLPPSILLIPSLHPWDHPRDYAPPLAVAFSHAAKAYSAQDAKRRSRRRLIAIAAEEGGVRVVDADEPVGMFRDSQGWFWRAHGNAVLDVKWSADDSKILTASGDATARIHALNGPTPSLVASLTGHEGSLKSCTYFDPTGGSIDPAIASTTIATAGRDGNILIYDVRTRGSPSAAAGRRTRGGYSTGVPGFAPQPGGEIGPVMEIRGAHDGPRRGPKSISSIVALKTLPGRLASAAGHEGIVKVWDPRLHSRSSSSTAVASLPDPTAIPPSKRVRGVQSMVEQPSTGDLHILTADSKVHVVRPSALLSGCSGVEEAIQPVRYTHPELRSSFWMGLSFSPCGRYLASGSSRGGVMTWDTSLPAARGYNVSGMRDVVATRMGLGQNVPGWEREREVNAVDWGYDMLAACADDCGTRLWREDADVGRRMKVDPKLREEYAGAY